MNKKIQQRFRRAVHFAAHDVWDIELSALPTPKQLAVRLVRVLHLVVRGFRDDNLSLHASALTYITLISLVPFLAFVLSVGKGMGGTQMETQVMAWYASAVEEAPEQFRTFTDQVLQIVMGANYAALGGMAMLLWVFTVIKVLGSIEASFNRVWGISASRPLFRKVTDYLSTLIVVTILLIAGATTSVDTLFAHLGLIGDMSKPLMLKLAPWLFTSLALGILYNFMPNTRVKVLPTLSGGMIGAALLLGWQRLFVAAQVGVFSKDVIFGAFAAIPIFLLWLYVCWVIILIGVEIAFAFQNTTTFEKEAAAAQASMETRLRLGLSIMREAAQAMLEGGGRFDKADYTRRHAVSIRLVNRVIDVLVRTGMLVRTSEPGDAYVLCRVPSEITVKTVLDAMYRDGVQPERLGVHRLEPPVEEALAAVNGRLGEALSGQTLQDIVLSGAATPKPGL